MSKRSAKRALRGLTERVEVYQRTASDKSFKRPGSLNPRKSHSMSRRRK